MKFLPLILFFIASMGHAAPQLAAKLTSNPTKTNGSATSKIPDPLDVLSISPDEAARRAQKTCGGGRILSVEPSPAGWRVTLLNEQTGVVRVVNIPD